MPHQALAVRRAAGKLLEAAEAAKPL